MTNKSALLELASRCEAATDLGWADIVLLNEDIHAIAPDPKVIVPPDYCRSLDAAMSLVPEEWPFKQATDMDDGDCAFTLETDDETVVARAKTWALAITAAALRALAKEKGE